MKAPQEVCEPQEITESGTTITSPGYNGNSGSYPNLASCNWTVVAAHNQVDLRYIITHVTTILNLIKNYQNKVVIMVSLHRQTLRQRQRQRPIKNGMHRGAHTTQRQRQIQISIGFYAHFISLRIHRV